MGRIILPYPHPGQQAVRAGARRINWYAMGRRWRKTTLFMTIAVEGALRGKECIWGAPTYDQVRVGWDEAAKAAGMVAHFAQSRMTAEFPGRGRIVYRSLDNPDNARGHTADLVLLDEAADIHPDAWPNVIRPMLMDTNGEAHIGGTPKGRNWFWNGWMNAQDRADSTAWQAPSLGVEIGPSGLVRAPHPLENPNIPFGEIEQLYQTLPERVFRQEILAEFIEDTGGVFRGVATAATAQVEEPQPNRQYVMGVDWGKSNDYTVFSVIDVAAHRQVAVDRSNKVDYAVQRGRLLALYGRYKPSVIIAESNSMGEPIIEQLHRDGLPVRGFQTTNATKAQAIEALALAFEQGGITVLDDATQTAELQAYEMTRLPSGMVRYSAPEGMHDDTVMALALAWHACARTGGAGLAALW